MLVRQKSRTMFTEVIAVQVTCTWRVKSDGHSRGQLKKRMIHLAAHT